MAATQHNPVISVASPKDAWPSTCLWMYECALLQSLQVGWIVFETLQTCWWYLTACTAVFATVVYWMSSLGPAVVAMLLAITLPFMPALVHRIRSVSPWIIDLYSTIVSNQEWDSSCCYWVAHCYCKECKGAVVAVIGAKRIDEDGLELVRLAVRSTMRRHGLGWKLSNKVIDFAKANSYREICLSSLSFFGPATKLYLKLGFRVVRRQPFQARLLQLPITVLRWKLETPVG